MATDDEDRPRTKGTWGGYRPGAGRKRKSDELPHQQRPDFDGRHPVRVTLRMRDDVPNLRTRKLFEQVKEALQESANRNGCRVVHYCVQRDRVHLIVETKGKDAMRRGMVGLQGRITRRLNHLLGREGRLTKDRYDARPLRGPEEVRDALAWVLNAQRRTRRGGKPLPDDYMDPCSTAERFYMEGRGQARAHTWLLREGWRNAGLLDPTYVPETTDPEMPWDR